MINILLIIVIITMILIMVEDFRSNEISILLLIIFYTSVIIYISFFNTWRMTAFAINMAILLIMYGILKLVYIFKKKSSSIVEKQLGLGDVIIIIGFTMVFSPINFMLFLNISFIAAIVYYYALRKRNRLIPLAGVIAFVYTCIILSSIISGTNTILFHNDFVIIEAL